MRVCGRNTHNVMSNSAECSHRLLLYTAALCCINTVVKKYMK